MTSKNILAIVLAGGEGSRLRPLTADHAKPALPFAGGCRIVDFVLSNLINSEISSIYLLAQYKPDSLMRHVRDVWQTRREAFRINLVVPEARNGPFLGTAHAVFRNLHLIERDRPDIVAVFAADHVYRMDVRQMVDFHIARAAEVTVAAVPVPIHEASSFGVIVADRSGRIRDFQEKPQRPVSLPTDPCSVFASMGNYLFNPDVLVEMLHRTTSEGGIDFGRHVLPCAAQGRRAFAYDFSNNHVPGLRSYEERTYWRDVGTLAAYEAALRDVRGEKPRFCLANAKWPIPAVMSRLDRAERTLPARHGRPAEIHG